MYIYIYIYIYQQNTNKIPTEYQQIAHRVPAAAAPQPAQLAARQAGLARALLAGPARAPLLLVCCWYSIGTLLVFY